MVEEEKKDMAPQSREPQWCLPFLAASLCIDRPRPPHAPAPPAVETGAAPPNRSLPCRKPQASKRRAVSPAPSVAALRWRPPPCHGVSTPNDPKGRSR
jgi:hypothetical protein